MQASTLSDFMDNNKYVDSILCHVQLEIIIELIMVNVPVGEEVKYTVLVDVISRLWPRGVRPRE